MRDTWWTCNSQILDLWRTCDRLISFHFISSQFFSFLHLSLRTLEQNSMTNCNNVAEKKIKFLRALIKIKTKVEKGADAEPWNLSTTSLWLKYVYALFTCMLFSTLEKMHFWSFIIIKTQKDFLRFLKVETQKFI